MAFVGEGCVINGATLSSLYAVICNLPYVTYQIHLNFQQKHYEVTNDHPLKTEATIGKGNETPARDATQAEASPP